MCGTSWTYQKWRRSGSYSGSQTLKVNGTSRYWSWPEPNYRPRWSGSKAPRNVSASWKTCAKRATIRSYQASLTVSPKARLKNCVGLSSTRTIRVLRQPTKTWSLSCTGSRSNQSEIWHARNRIWWKHWTGEPSRISLWAVRLRPLAPSKTWRKPGVFRSRA